MLLYYEDSSQISRMQFTWSMFAFSGKHIPNEIQALNFDNPFPTCLTTAYWEKKLNRRRSYRWATVWLSKLWIFGQVWCKRFLPVKIIQSILKTLIYHNYANCQLLRTQDILLHFREKFIHQQSLVTPVGEHPGWLITFVIVLCCSGIKLYIQKFKTIKNVKW